MWFGLSKLMTIKPRTFMEDEDISEIFHNFVLEDKIQPYIGVEFPQFYFDPKNLKGLKIYY